MLSLSSLESYNADNVKILTDLMMKQRTTQNCSTGQLFYLRNVQNSSNLERGADDKGYMPITADVRPLSAWRGIYCWPVTLVLFML